MFHAVGAPPSDAKPLLDPAQVITPEALDGFIAYFRRFGYDFVDPGAVANGLPPEGRYGLISFDDGYYNNHEALPVLHRHGVPATFFITTGHVERQTAFWWDVVFRERTGAGASREEIAAEQVLLKSRTPDEIDRYLVAEFGADALRPRGDADRPMTLDELADFAQDPLVRIGNHTVDHAILTNLPGDQVRSQIAGAQDTLERVCGTAPISIAFPNGNFSPSIIDVAEQLGLRVGLTVVPHRNPVPDGSTASMSLGRFSFTMGADTPLTYRGYRSGSSLREWVRSFRGPRGLD